MKWFEDFSSSLKREDSMSDLIPAGKLGIEEALEQYRYQYRAKITESLEESFPSLKQQLGKDWEEKMEAFLAAEISFRSLDWYPEGFSDFFLQTQPPLGLAELCRFEVLLDRFAWDHSPQLVSTELQFSEDSVLSIGEYEIHRFRADVISLYEDEKSGENHDQEIIFWMKNAQVHFREMSYWEKAFLVRLKEGMKLGEALGTIDQTEEVLISFFHWLGGSGLVRQSRNSN